MNTILLYRNNSYITAVKVPAIKDVITLTKELVYKLDNNLQLILQINSGELEQISKHVTVLEGETLIENLTYLNSYVHLGDDNEEEIIAEYNVKIDKLNAMLRNYLLNT